MKRTILLRKIVQLAMLALFLITVLQATYPFNPWVPPELFLWLDPLAGLATMIASRSIILWFGLGLGILLLGLVFGRAFCGWVCPLGTILDITDKLFRFRDKKRAKAASHHHWKRYTLILFGVLAIFGVQLTWLLDPLPLLWRTFGSVVFPLTAAATNGIFDGLFALGMNYDWIYDSYDFIALHVLPLEPVSIRGAFIVGFVFLTIVGLGSISKRFWCRNLCPLGALLGYAGRFSLLSRHVDVSTCTQCRRCSKNCKMGAIGTNGQETDKGECILCLNCADECSPGSTTFRFQKQTQTTLSPDPSRRQFIATTSAGLAASAAFAVASPLEQPDPTLVRPPGALDEDEFLEKCIRCNECVRICSTTGACLQPVWLKGGVEGFWSPAADFEAGYCEYNCNLCGQICPTSAITPLAVASKQKAKMGIAVFDKELCLPHAKHENCIVCEEHCPTPEKAITFERIPTEREDGTHFILLRPLVHEELCIGCGICENKCPLDPPAIRVVRIGASNGHSESVDT